jgi:transcriptional regulator GlxA family with amidase domain
MTSGINIAMFDGFDEIDVFGPFEILSSAGFSVQLVTAGPPGLVTSMRGLKVEVTAQLEASDGVIGVIVPGGGWLTRAPMGAWAEVQRGDLTARLVELDPHVRWLASVCTGGMVLAHAGLLRGRPATTNRGCFEDFRPHVGEVIDERVVDAGTRITSGALFSGVDLGLWIIERELGTATADRVAASTEYRRHGRVWRSPGTQSRQS